MTQQELTKCRQAAHLFRQIKAENVQLRAALAEKEFVDRQMDDEDAQAFALVARNHPDRAAPVIHIVQKRPFDYDTADIEEVEGEIVAEPKRAPIITNRVLSYYIRFSLWVVAETVVWIAHHFGWVTFLQGLTISLIVMLLSNILK